MQTTFHTHSTFAKPAPAGLVGPCRDRRELGNVASMASLALVARSVR
jgi:hypothetical protein